MWNQDKINFVRIINKYLELNLIGWMISLYLNLFNLSSPYFKYIFTFFLWLLAYLSNLNSPIWLELIIIDWKIELKYQNEGSQYKIRKSLVGEFEKNSKDDNIVKYSEN